MTSPTSTTTSPSSSSLPSTSSQSAFTPSSYFTSIARRRQQKKMSITQTYYLAHTARKKLTREASRPDHDLRLLVGHANLLDSLMLDLADAEQEQERWFNQTVSGVTKGSQRSESQHIKWAEAVVEEPGDDWDPEEASDADSDDSDFEDDYTPEPYKPVRRRAPSPVAIITETELDEEEDDSESDSDSDFEYDNAEDLDELALTRSHSRQSPPELLLDEDEDSEDDTMPPSPSQPILETFDNKQMQTNEIPFTDSDFEHGYYVPAPTQGPMIEAC
ncbi:hypothetical protein ARAM_000914 [Aspergillus rambellii]|uniref:Uncharacterized protein n=1 Tax=Aspergillus rambellii TaxID=308745 RepID=A0A0F8U117_9EURO|nr:hypothetical protein ARAM_000914 [Aspergillus rambellii]